MPTTLRSSNGRPKTAVPLVVAANNPSDHQIVRLSDLSSDGSHSSRQFPNAVAVATDGTVATGADGDFVKTYRPGSTWPSLHEYAVNDLQRDGLAWAPDENRLFAITGFSYGQRPHPPRPPGRRQAGHHPRLPGTGDLP